MPVMGNDQIKEQLIAKFNSGRAHVAVIGLGYVGLPLSLTFAQAGYRVSGIELNSQRVAMLNRGVSHIEDISSAELAMYVAQVGIAQVETAQSITTEAHVTQPAFD